MAIAASIGLVAESINRHKSQQAQRAPQRTAERRELSQVPDSEGEDQQQPQQKNKIRNPAHLADDFLKRYPPPPPGTASGWLRLPVIIPQRRPGVRVRGFVRAYAPDLEPCGIDQDTFMDSW
ncbi:hypothetical protein BDW66DRAFT_155090 [Aspergillus desertorum]